jgi:hypothetical protein
MSPEIEKELRRRCDILIQHAKPNAVELGMTGSMFRFDCCLAPIGYPFEPLEWMDEEYIKPIMTKDEYHSTIYDDLIEELYNKTWYSVYGKFPK